MLLLEGQLAQHGLPTSPTTLDFNGRINLKVAHDDMMLTIPYSSDTIRDTGRFAETLLVRSDHENLLKP